MACVHIYFYCSLSACHLIVLLVSISAGNTVLSDVKPEPTHDGVAAFGHFGENVVEHFWDSFWFCGTWLCLLVTTHTCSFERRQPQELPRTHRLSRSSQRKCSAHISLCARNLWESNNVLKCGVQLGLDRRSLSERRLPRRNVLHMIERRATSPV